MSGEVVADVPFRLRKVDAPDTPPRLLADKLRFAVKENSVTGLADLESDPSLFG